MSHDPTRRAHPSRAARRWPCDGGLRRRGDRGSVSVEMTVLVVPLMVVLALFVALCARGASAAIDVHAAASAASRAASLARSPGTARDAAATSAALSLGGQRLTCAGLQVSVDTSQFHPGGSVAVTLQCVVTLSDLGVPGVPGSRTLAATASSPLDVYREFDAGP
jgi:Flp pilus assembly protein TadG